MFTLAAVGIHPTALCIGCETATPFGHVETRLDDLLQSWLIIAPFVAGLLKLGKGWVVLLAMVIAQLMAQLVGGEPWLDFDGVEKPFIILFGLPVFFLSLLAGYASRQIFGFLRRIVKRAPIVE